MTYTFERWKPEVRQELQRQLILTAEILDVEAAEARRVLMAEARAAFQPYIEAIPEEREPSSICFFALTGGNKRQQVGLPPDIRELIETSRNEIIATLIQEHMAKSGGRIGSSPQSLDLKDGYL
jgi:hypothetical protein